MDSHPNSTPHRASFRFPLWQSALIGATGMMLLVKVASGTLPFYVHVRYTPLILATGVVLILLALLHGWFTLRGGAEPHDHDHEPHDHHGPRSWRSPAMLALLLPILLGLLVPSRALSGAAIDSRGFGTGGSGMRTVQSVARDGVALGIPDPSSWTMLDWVNALLYEPDNPRLQGQPIELTGFVWRRAEQGGDHFVVSRFVVSCCTADSLAIGLPVLWAGTGDLKNDQWVRVSGTVGLAEIEGKEEAVILATDVSLIDQPAEPYVYP